MSKKAANDSNAPTAKSAVTKALEQGAGQAAQKEQDQQREPYATMPASLAQAILNYLDTRPHREARPLIDALQQHSSILPAAKVETLMAEAKAQQALQPG